MYAIIMAGGSGTRFWPMSRRQKPKQLLSFFSEKTMIAETAERIAPLSPWSNMVVVTGAHLLQPIAEALPNLPPENLLAEPAARNTAPCIGLAVEMIQKRAGHEEDPVIGVFPADHHIGNPAVFLDDIRKAIEAAREPGTIVTLGIQPTHPETGYGYIQCAPGSDPNNALEVKRFVEKPNRATAESYLQSGDYLWNAGLFFFRASTMKEEISRQLPSMSEGLAKIAPHLDTPQQDEALSQHFPNLESVSIDYGVMENAKKVKVVPTAPAWNDVGHWAALPSLLDLDDQNNHFQGDVLQTETKSSLVINEVPNHPVALVGVEGLVVVHTRDATLIVPTEKAQEVREIVRQLKAEGRQDKL